MQLIEKRAILYHLKNIIKPRARRYSGHVELCDWVEMASQELLGMDLSEYWRDEECPKGLTQKEAKAWGAKPLKCVKTLGNIINKRKIYPVYDRSFDQKVDILLDIFTLSKHQKDLLRFMIYLKKYHEFYKFLQDCFDIAFGHNYRASEVSMVSGVPYSVVEECFSEFSPLVLYGIFTKDDMGRICNFTPNFCKMINSKYSSKEDIKEIILSKDTTPRLSSDDFDYISEEFSRCKKLLSSALKKREKGINIMLYGSVGTGKSEFAKAVCSELGVNFYMLSEGKAGSEKMARFSDLSIAQTLLEGDRNSVIIMDEAEDMFPIFMRSLGSNDPDNPLSKLFLNRMLENNKTPVIWISNNVRSMDPAFVRRFTYTLEIKKPDDKAKVKIWQNILRKNSLELSEDNIMRLVKNHDVVPAFIDMAVRSARLIGDAGEIENTLKNLQKATIGYLPPPRHEDSVEFSPALLNTDTDLMVLTENIITGGIRRFSLCLYGVPGTGKSAYARHLADKMGLKVLHKRASDLIGSYVGETEQNIVRVFNQAHEDSAMLVFDEVDSFLRDRSLAGYSWEVSQVNEMLTWMESHPLPFICTTNLMDGLDKASLRRFTFKVKYDYLNKAQVVGAFRHFFDADLPPTMLCLDHLTPGDFAVVKSKADILGIREPSRLAKLLANEQEMKGERTRAVGFMG